MNEDIEEGASGSAYDESLNTKAGKRKREENPQAAAKAVAKKEEAASLAAGMDWKGMLAKGTLQKATVAQLKAYCQTKQCPEVIDW